MDGVSAEGKDEAGPYNSTSSQQSSPSSSSSSLISGFRNTTNSIASFFTSWSANVAESGSGGEDGVGMGGESLDEVVEER